MRALVTGGAGFIGHHLVQVLVKRGDEVTVIDDFSSGDRARLAPLAGQITLVEGSILDPAALDRAAASCEVVFHEAAIASVARSIADPILSDAVNVRGTIEVVLAAARHGARRVVYAGSAAAYGMPATLPCREDQVPAPVSPYGVGKLAGEHYVHALGQIRGLDTVVLRYFNVFGPSQDPASEYAAVVPRFVTAVLEGHRPVVNGSGEITRDFVFVDNVVEANLLAARSTCPSGLTCNIASGTMTSLRDLLDAIGEAVGSRMEPIFGPPREGDIAHSYADIAVAQRTLGYEVEIPFREGIRRTVTWYREFGSGFAGGLPDPPNP